MYQTYHFTVESKKNLKQGLGLSMWLRSSDRLLDASKNHAPEKNRDFVLGDKDTGSRQLGFGRGVAVLIIRM
jgi:hypothetical protein